MAWRVARSLDTLLNQFNQACPRRNKRSDGAIGDTAHSNRNSDHNPWYGPGIVTARDFTHDPANGMDIDEITDQLAASRDSRIKYIIANRLILDSRSGNNPWRWVRYNGSNPHTSHFHLSVMASPICDDTRAWNLPMFKGTTPPPTQPPSTLLKRGSRGADVSKLQGFLNRYYSHVNLVVDGIFGGATENAVKEFQRRYGHGLAVDGIVGPATRKAMGL